jgi:hypothetical protein
MILTRYNGICRSFVTQPGLPKRKIGGRELLASVSSVCGANASFELLSFETNKPLYIIITIQSIYTQSPKMDPKAHNELLQLSGESLDAMPANGVR